MSNFDSYTISQYSREEIVDTLKRIHAKFPAVFKWFFMWELRGQAVLLSESDAEKLGLTKNEQDT